MGFQGQFNPLQLVAMRGDLGVSVSDAAKAETKALDPSRTQIQTARRKLERLVDSELASKTEPQHGGNERRGAVYYITEIGTKTYEKQRSERSVIGCVTNSIRDCVNLFEADSRGHRWNSHQVDTPGW